MSDRTNNGGRMVLLGTIGLILSLFVVSRLLQMEGLDTAVRLGLVAIPVTAWIVSLLGYSRMIERLDELQKRVHLEALAFAFSGLAVAIIACEYLRKAGFITALKPDYVLAMMMILWPIGFLLAWRRYQ
ncbi:MAG: hypothetical protein ABI882_07530 [Acidobacteriota bacterium]